MKNSESEQLHDLLAKERQRENPRWRCPNCQHEMSTFVEKCSYCSAQIHQEEHLAGSEDTQAIERFIEQEHHAEGGKVLCQFCHTQLDAHVYKCPTCGAHAAGMDGETETSRYLAGRNLPLVLLWLGLGMLLGVLVWNLF